MACLPPQPLFFGGRIEVFQLFVLAGFALASTAFALIVLCWRHFIYLNLSLLSQQTQRAS
jgi:hypothetical protein